MTDLNVTEGNWAVDFYHGEHKVWIEDSEVNVTSAISRDDAYLIAQAKKMYDEMQRDVKLLNKQLGCYIMDDILRVTLEFKLKTKQDLLNACKPPENKNERMDKC